MKLQVKFALTGLAFSLLAIGLYAQNAPPRAQRAISSGPLSASEIFARSHASVVVIFAADQNGQRQVLGSGFIVARGKIATNHHVLQGMSNAQVVFSDGEVKSVSGVVADSPQQDLIILSADTGDRSPLVLGDELSLQQGASVYALGAPQGLDLSLTNGIVSSFRNVNGQFLIQNTAAISHGSSGGPLFDQAGRVVGITSSMLANSPGIYFSVGVGVLKRLLRTPDLVTLPLKEWAQQSASDSPGAEAAPDEASDAGEVKQIEQLLESKKFDTVKAALQELATKEPDSEVVHRLTGELDFRTGDINGAISEFNSSVQKAPKDALAHYDYAVALFIASRFDDALAEEETSYKLEPTTSDESFLAELYYANKLYSQAELMARQTLDANSNDQTALDVLAGLAFHRESSYVRVRDSNGKSWDIPQNNLSAARQSDPNLQVMSEDQVFADYANRLSSIDSGDFWANCSKAGLAVTNKQDDQVVAYLEAAEKSDFPDPMPYLALIELYEVQMHLGQAEDQVEAGLASVPQNPDLLASGMFVSLLSRNNSEAARRFGTLESLYPTIGITLSSGCLYYYGIQQPSSALPYCAQLIKQYPDDHTSHSNYGWVALDANNFSLALEEFSKAYKLASPDWAKLDAREVVDLLWGFTIADYYSGATKDARKLLKFIRTKYPTAATVTGLQQMPLLWSSTTMSRIETILAKYPK